jgi:hypothetical protein
MKNLNTIKKLSLAKETLVKLRNLDLKMIKGGAITNTCATDTICKHKPTTPLVC